MIIITPIIPIVPVVVVVAVVVVVVVVVVSRQSSVVSPLTAVVVGGFLQGILSTACVKLSANYHFNWLELQNTEVTCTVNSPFCGLTWPIRNTSMIKAVTDEFRWVQKINYFPSELFATRKIACARVSPRSS